MAIDYMWYPHFGEYTLTGTILEEGISSSTGPADELFTGDILTGTFVYWSDRVGFLPISIGTFGDCFCGQWIRRNGRRTVQFLRL